MTTKLLYFNTDGGRQYAVGDTTGFLDPQVDGATGWAGWKQAGAASAAHGFGAARAGSAELPGMAFFRNRAYDQQTGLWTQEDPIGVAGGINLYQFVSFPAKRTTRS